MMRHNEEGSTVSTESARRMVDIPRTVTKSSNRRLYESFLLCACGGILVSIGVHAQQSPIGPSYGPVGAPAHSSSTIEKSGGGGLTLTAVPEDFSHLKIAPGVLLDSQVYGEPDLSGHLRVGDDGKVSVPLAGTVQVAGKTLDEARQAIEARLRSSEILKNPQVTLNILQYSPMIVSVLGEVNTPGRLQLLAPHNLLDVISFAGGETPIAGGEVQLREQNGDGKTTTSTYHYGRDSDGQEISQVMVHNGDTVIVPRAGIVYVLGAVNRPGGYLMQENGKLDAAQALALALGTAMQARTGAIRIIRRQSDGSYVEFQLSYKDMTNGKMTPPQLQAQDIVYVPVNKLKAAFTSGSSIIGSATAATIYAVH